MMKIDKKSRLIGRIFSIAFGLALAKTLYDGGYHYDSMGHAYRVTAEADPVKYYLSCLWYLSMFIVASYFGFVAKVK